MPGDEENQVPGRKLQQGTVVPNEERAVPRRADRIQRADPRWVRFFAGALTVTLTATSAAVPPTDAFLNSTNRINTGEDMSPAVQAAPARVNLAADDFQKAESVLAYDPNFDMQTYRNSMAAIRRSGDEDLVLHQVNRFFMDLDQLAAGRTATRGFLVNFDADSLTKIVEDYKSIIAEGKEQELEFFKFRVIAIFANAYVNGEGSGRYSSALPDTLTSAFDGATADVTRMAEVAQSAQVPWYQQIWGIRDVVAFLTGPSQVVPTPVEAPPETVTVSEHVAFEMQDSSTGATIQMNGDELIQSLLDLGVPEEMIDLFANLDWKGMLGITYSLVINEALDELYAPAPDGTPPVVTNQDIEDTIYMGQQKFAVMAGTMFPDQLRAQGIDPNRVQEAGTLAGLIALGVAALDGILAMVGSATQRRFTNGRGQLDTVLTAARARFAEDVVAARQAADPTRRAEYQAQMDAYRQAGQTLSRLEEQVKAKEATAGNEGLSSRQRAAAQIALDGPTGHPEQGLRAQLEQARAAFHTAETALPGVGEISTRMTTLMRNIEAAANGTLARNPGESRIAAALRASGLDSATILTTTVNGRIVSTVNQGMVDGVLGNVQLVNLDLPPAAAAPGAPAQAAPAAAPQAERMRLVIDYSPSRGTASARVVGEFEIDPTSAWGRVWVDPVRYARQPGISRGERVARWASVPFRVGANAWEEAWKAKEVPRTGNESRVVGILGLAATLGIAGFIDYELFAWSTPSRPATRAGRGGTAATTTTQPPQINETNRQSAYNFTDLTNRLGNTTYRNLREELEMYRKYVLGTVSRDFGPDTRNTQALAGVNTAAVQAATEFLNNFQNSTSTPGTTADQPRTLSMTADQAELEFYRQYFLSFGTPNAQGVRTSALVSLIDTYVPESERLAIYKMLFTDVAMHGDPVKAITDESALFAGLMKKSSRIRDMFAPILDVIDARMGWEDVNRAALLTQQNTAMPQVATYMTNLSLSIIVRAGLVRPGVTPDIEDVALGLARAYMVNNPDITKRIEGFTDANGNRVPGFFSDVSTQLDAYKKVLAYMQEHPNDRLDVIINNVLLEMIPANRRSAAMQLLQVSTAEIETGAAVQAQSLENARTILRGRERGEELLEFIDACLEKDSDKLAAYNSLIQYFTSNPDYANADYVELREQFLVNQLGNYAHMRAAVEAFFSGPQLDSALAYLIKLTKQATTEPGVGRTPTEADVANLLVRQLADQNPDLGNDLNVLYIGDAARRRGQFDMNRFTMLLDAALFIKNTREQFARDNPGAEIPAVTSGQLKEHVINRFQNYPGLRADETLLDPNTVLPDRFFDLAITLLPMRYPESGAPLASEDMRTMANSPPYWSYRTTDWVRGQYESLNATEKTRLFTFLPEELQREYWNGMTQTQRDAIWKATAPRGDTFGIANSIAAWKTAHDFLKQTPVSVTTGRGRHARTRTVREYPEWPEVTPAATEAPAE